MEHHFDVQEAVIYGVEKAVMLNNFRFWLTKNRANNHQNIDDYYWTFNSATALAEIWPYLNAKKISCLVPESNYTLYYTLYIYLQVHYMYIHYIDCLNL